MLSYENLTLEKWEMLDHRERYKIFRLFINDYRSDIEKITGGTSETMKIYLFGFNVGKLDLFAVYEGTVDDEEIKRIKLAKGVPCFIVSTGPPTETEVEISDLY